MSDFFFVSRVFDIELMSEVSAMSASDENARMRVWKRFSNLYNEKKCRFQPAASGNCPQRLESPLYNELVTLNEIGKNASVLWYSEYIKQMLENDEKKRVIMNENQNIKDGIFYNSNPELNPRAVALWSIGKVDVNDIVWFHGIEYRVTETGIRIRQGGKLFKHGIKVESVKTGLGDILTNEKESSDFNTIWVS